MAFIRGLVPVVVIGLILAYLSMFRVYQWEQAIVFKFREVQDTVNEPGLHFMIPWINTVQKFETRLLNFDQEEQRFLTIEKKDVLVDYYVKWRISNVEEFYTATRGGDIQYANGLLGQRINRGPYVMNLVEEQYRKLLLVLEVKFWILFNQPQKWCRENLGLMSLMSGQRR